MRIVRSRIAAGVPGLVLVLALAFPARLPGQPAELLQRPRRAERTRNYDVRHYDLKFDFDFAAKAYRAENGITVLPLEDGFRTCVLDAEEFTVTGVVDGRGAALRYLQSEKELAVELSEPAPYGQPVSFIVRFTGSRPKAGMKFIDASPGRPAQINTYSWPEDAHHWFPCNDYPNDKATNDMEVTVPAGFKVLSNGRPAGIEENPGAGTATFRWSQDRPHPVYGIMIAAGPFQVLEDSLGKLPVSYWVYPEDAADAPRSFRKTPRMIEFYEHAFGIPYPWAKYDQVCVAGYGGGMEATSATILGDATIHDARAEQDFSSDGLVAHELAHMWWGDLLTPRTWADVWLSESFATYAEHLFSRFDRGEDDGAVDLEEKKDAYLEEARTRYIRPIVFDRYNQPWEIMDAHSYPKGAAVLHMLRFVLGDAPFFRVLNRFLAKFAFGIADTHDFSVAIKEATGQNLDWFIEQWILRPGHPVFKVASSWDEKSGKLSVAIDQIQDFGAGVPVFRTPVIIGIADGRTRVSRKVWIDSGSQVFEFPCAAKPLDVRFDEGNHLLKELVFPKTVDELAFASENDDVVGRMTAAAGLGRSGDSGRAAGILAGLASSDPFWAVRKSAFEALGSLNGPVDAGLLKKGCLDPDSRVRAEAVRALSARTGRSGPAGFFRTLFRKDSSYAVQAAALRALGACGRPGDLPFLDEAARLPSPGNILKRAAASAAESIKAAGKTR